jgi:hypothetical protein
MLLFSNDCMTSINELIYQESGKVIGTRIVNVEEPTIVRKVFYMMR